MLPTGMSEAASPESRFNAALMTGVALPGLFLAEFVEAAAVTSEFNFSGTAFLQQEITLHH